MKLIIHVGNHKTGSTAIQTALSENENKLLSKGIIYPRTGRIKNAHHDWALAMRNVSVPGFNNNGNLTGLINELRAEISKYNPNAVILSSEEFYPSNIEEYSKLNSLFSLFDSVEIACVLRGQVAHLESGYKFSILWDVTRNKEDFSEYLQRQLKDKYHEYHKTMLSYRASDWFSKITVMDFDELITGGRLVANFLSTLGIHNIDIKEVNNNKSLSRIATIGLRLHNNGFGQDISREDFIETLSCEALQLKDSFFDTASISNVIESFNKSNEILKDNFLVDLNMRNENYSRSFDGEFLRPRDIFFLFSILHGDNF